MVSSNEIFFGLFLIVSVTNTGGRVPLPCSFVLWYCLPSGDYVVASTGNGESLQGSKIIVTVPLQVLKRDIIRFNPELSAAKRLAIEKVQMEPAIKIACRFQRVLWKADLVMLCCSSGIVSQCWPCVQQAVNSPQGHRAQAAANYSSAGLGDKREARILCECCRDKLDCADWEESGCRTDAAPRLAASDGWENAPADVEEGMWYVRREDIGLTTVSPVNGDCSQCVLMFGFATADIAEEANGLPAATLVQKFLSQLDDMFR